MPGLHDANKNAVSNHAWRVTEDYDPLVGLAFLASHGPADRAVQ